MAKALLRKHTKDCYMHIIKTQRATGQMVQKGNSLSLQHFDIEHRTEFQLVYL